jgi:hypothetical protein
MALEYLLKLSSGSIFDEVEKNIVSSLVLNYLKKHLDDYKFTLEICIVQPTPSIAEQYSIQSYRQLNSKNFFDVLRDDNEADHIFANLVNYPLVENYLRSFREHLMDESKILDLLQKHEQNLKWHVLRMYRTRCDIVHSAQHKINLTLLSANLEYYLKSMLETIIEKLELNPSISGLEELFNRLDYRYKEVCKELGEKKSDSLIKYLSDYIV